MVKKSKFSLLYVHENIRYAMIQKSTKKTAATLVLGGQKVIICIKHKLHMLQTKVSGIMYKQGEFIEVNWLLIHEADHSPGR